MEFQQALESGSFLRVGIVPIEMTQEDVTSKVQRSLSAHSYVRYSRVWFLILTCARSNVCADQSR